jgi:hypothetical protein
MTDKTRLVPGLAAPHTDGTNLMWTAATALAWRELQALAGGPIVLAPNGADAEEAAAAEATVAALNEGQVDDDSVDPEACVARAGYQTDAFIAEVRAELARKLPDARPRLLPQGEAPDRFIAWAYLEQHLRFAAPFFRPSWPLHFRKSFVECFGVSRQNDVAEWEKRARQVRIHHPCYTEDEVERMTDAEFEVMYDHCVVELHSERTDLRLLLAMIPRGATLRETVQGALRYVDRNPADHPHARLEIGERFEAPILDLDLVREHNELRGRAIATGPLAGQRFGDVVGAARFRLDEGGASMTAEWLARGLSLPPRELIFGQPFLVMILRKGAALPMFALWVENTEPMQVVPPP